MHPTSFAESNRVLSRPETLTEEQCDPLSVMVAKNEDGMPMVISCWKLTAEELEEINKTGRVWLCVCSAFMPPVSLYGIKFF